MNNYYIVSPKDIIFAEEHDDDDRLEWFINTDQYEEALEFYSKKNFKNKIYSYTQIGRKYIRYLINNNQLDLAAASCQKFLRTSEEWDMEAAAFLEKRAIKTLVPFLPTEQPQLRACIYGMALREFLDSNQFKEYLHWIKTWPSSIFDLKDQTSELYRQINRVKSRELIIALRILLEYDQK